MPAVTRVGGRGDGAAVDDGPLCRRRADAAAPSSRGRDLGGRGPMRRVLRQADGGRAQTSLSWLADTLLSQDRPARIKFCRPTAVRDAPLGVRPDDAVEPAAVLQHRSLAATALPSTPAVGATMSLKRIVSVTSVARGQRLRRSSSLKGCPHDTMISGARSDRPEDAGPRLATGPPLRRPPFCIVAHAVPCQRRGESHLTDPAASMMLSSPPGLAYRQG